MPNFFSAFTSEVFRPIATLVIPGTIGLCTWFIGLLWCFPELKKLVTNNHTESGFLLFLAIIFAGIVFEDWGARWESALDKKADAKDSGQHSLNWFGYLRSSFIADPIGRRYIRTVVLRLKFELGIAFAMISAFLGLLWLVWLGLGYRVALPFSVVAFAFAGWGFYEARETHAILATTRAELLKEIRIVR